MGEESGVAAVGKAALFGGFLKIGMLGFGGVAPWARYVIVEERRWLTDREFASVLGLGQVLPGPNTMNAAVVIGDRFGGAAGAVVSVLGMLAVPVLVVTALGAVYARYAGVGWVGAALAGAAAGGAGLVVGTALKMARRIEPAPASIAIAAAAFVAIGVLQWPLVPVVAGLVPLGIAAAALERRR